MARLDEAVGASRSCGRRVVDHTSPAGWHRHGHSLAPGPYLPCPLAGPCRRRHAGAAEGPMVGRWRNPLYRHERSTPLVELAKVVEAWEGLPDHIRLTVSALVQTALQNSYPC